MVGVTTADDGGDERSYTSTTDVGCPSINPPAKMYLGAVASGQAGSGSRARVVSKRAELVSVERR